MLVADPFLPAPIHATCHPFRSSDSACGARDAPIRRAGIRRRVRDEPSPEIAAIRNPADSAGVGGLSSGSSPARDRVADTGSGGVGGRVCVRSGWGNPVGRTLPRRTCEAARLVWIRRGLSVASGRQLTENWLDPATFRPTAVYTSNLNSVPNHVLRVFDRFIGRGTAAVLALLGAAGMAKISLSAFAAFPWKISQPGINVLLQKALALYSMQPSRFAARTFRSFLLCF